jgi:hypothetical protein
LLLYSSLARLVLEGDPPPDLLAEAGAVMRLDELRQRPGTRYALFLITV